MIRTVPKGWATIDSGPDGHACQQMLYPGQAVHASPGLRVIASWGGGWEHVSVSLPDRCPTWEEMELVAKHYWPNEAAVQYHLPTSDHINNHPYCLHW